MPPAGQNSTVPLQEVVDYARTFGELTPVLKTGGWADQPARSIADRVMETLLGGGYVAGRRVGPFPWKWNRTIPPAFLTNSWQQDYASVVAQAAGGTYNTLKWLADAILLDINNTALGLNQGAFGHIAVSTGASNAANITSALLIVTPLRYPQQNPPAAANV